MPSSCLIIAILIVRVFEKADCMADTGVVLIGFIVTIALIGLAAIATFCIFICLKWRDILKRRQVIPNTAQSRQPTRRNRRIRVQRATAINTSNNAGNAMLDLPPAYSEFAEGAPPPYSLLNPHLFRQGSSRTTTRGSVGLVTPATGARRDTAARRHSSFSMNIQTGGTNTPMETPTGNMFASLGVNTRELSAISDCRQTTYSDGIT